MSTDPMVGDTVSLAPAASVMIRPAAGEVWKITAFAVINNSGNKIHMYDGTNSAAFMTGAGTAATFDLSACNVPIDNDDYLLILNTAGGPQEVGYRGWKVV